MSGFFGADVEQLRQLGRDLTTQAEQLDATVARLNSKVLSVPWQGPDAERFRSDWSQRLSVSVKSVADILRDASSKSLANAVQQEQASGVSGAPSGLANGLSDPGILGPRGAAVPGLALADPGMSGPRIPGGFDPTEIIQNLHDAPDNKLGPWTAGQFGQFIPGIGEAIELRDYSDKISAGQFPFHELIDSGAGALRDQPNPVSYLAGAALGVWNTAGKAAEQSDFSSDQFNRNMGYLTHDTGDAIAGASQALVGILPDLVADILPGWLK